MKLHYLLAAIVCFAGFGESLAQVKVQHVPLVGVDTAGTHFRENKKYGDMGWNFPAFGKAMDDLGVEFLVDHYLQISKDGSHQENFESTAKRFAVLSEYLKESGIDYLWNLEEPNWTQSWSYVPGENLFEPEPGHHYLKLPNELLIEMQKSPDIRGVVYDELEHTQLYNNKYMLPGAKGDKPSLADTTQLKLAEAYELIYKKSRGLRNYYRSYGQDSVIEMVWPVMQHIYARAGWVISPKIMKENWAPVPLAMALGATTQYKHKGADLWVNPDLWFYGGRYPGHSSEELRSALLAAHWIGASRIYVENLDYVYVQNTDAAPNASKTFDLVKGAKGPHHADAHDHWGSLLHFKDENNYTLTPYGEVFRWYAQEYKDAHPVPYTWRDARCRVAIVRFPDSDWGQGRGGGFRDTLLGSKIEQSTSQTAAWLSLWHQLTLGTIPKSGITFYAKGVLNVYGPRFFCPVPPLLVFDHRAGDEHPDFDFGGAELIFLAGVEITPATFDAVERYLATSDAQCVALASLLPDGFDVPEKMTVVDCFDDPRVAKILKPHLPPADEMQYQFGEHEVVFKKINRDRIQVYLDGKAVSPVIESNSKTSLTPSGEEITDCPICR